VTGYTTAVIVMSERTSEREQRERGEIREARVGKEEENLRGKEGEGRVLLYNFSRADVPVRCSVSVVSQKLHSQLLIVTLMRLIIYLRLLSTEVVVKRTGRRGRSDDEHTAIALLLTNLDTSGITIPLVSAGAATDGCHPLFS